MPRYLSYGVYHTLKNIILYTVVIPTRFLEYPFLYGTWWEFTEEDVYKFEHSNCDHAFKPWHTCDLRFESSFLHRGREVLHNANSILLSPWHMTLLCPCRSTCKNEEMHVFTSIGA